MTSSARMKHAHPIEAPPPRPLLDAVSPLYRSAGHCLGPFHVKPLFSGISWLIILENKIRNINLSNQIKPKKLWKQACRAALPRRLVSSKSDEDGSRAKADFNLRKPLKRTQKNTKERKVTHENFLHPSLFRVFRAIHG